MADIANRDAAEQSLDIAKAALAANNLEKAQKFVDKAMKLYPSDEVACYRDSQFVQFSRHLPSKHACSLRAACYLIYCRSRTICHVQVVQQ